MFKQLLLPALLLTAGAAEAQGVRPEDGKQVSIPLAGRGDVRSFEVTRDGDGIYIQDFRRNWYLARFYSRCLDMPYAFTIGFKSFSSMSLDRGDTVLAGREQCRISSIVRSGPPPKKIKKPRNS
ncbi:DUF6491 family protein [Sphingomonas soli]|uniref:DUF6491 family protein n=1 Tax=Sphingomonas soli TaxID=266127 RepID=UPI00082E11A4|nr:DUF6491 family protein [Sphingomonas soli]